MSALAIRICNDAPAIAEAFPAGVTAMQLAFRYGEPIVAILPAMSWLAFNRQGRLTYRGAEAVFIFAASNENEKRDKAAWNGGARAQTTDNTLSRFASKPLDPDAAIDLRADHPALSEGRTIFTSTVISARESERLLVSGHNNLKLGAEVRKGAWAGMPIFHLTLEERATCPRSCALWAGCYGNAMHQAKRHDHRDPDFLTYLESELLVLAGQNPRGFVVRLHTLGDFYSVAYVEFWRRMLAKMPALRCFGYTANLPHASDEGEAAIGAAVKDLTEEAWDRFAIRFSGLEDGQGSIVVREARAEAHVIMCPAQTQRTAACGTCALCWSPAARGKTIAFLRHGMRGKRSDRQALVVVEHEPEAAPALPAIIKAKAPISAAADDATFWRAADALTSARAPGAAATFITRRYSECAWIDGEPAADARTCGAAVVRAGVAYCPDHLRDAYIGKRAKTA